MKKLTLSILACSIGLSVAAQCLPPSINQTYGNNPSGNAVTYGDITVVGGGMVNSGNNFLNFTNLRFQGNFSIFYPFNSNQHLWLNGVINYHAGISLTGGATVHLEQGSVVHIYNLVGNNGNNRILMYPGDSVKINQNYYHVGETFYGPNTSNNVTIESCLGTSLSLVKAEIRGSELIWSVPESPVSIQFSPDGKDFNSVFFNLEREGSHYLPTKGFYRLKYNQLYTKIMEYTGIDTPNSKTLYYLPGQGFTTTKPLNVKYYGTK